MFYHSRLILILIFLLFLSLLFSPCFAKKSAILNPALQYEQGLRFQREGNLKSAALYFNAALQLNPAHLPSLIGLSEVFLDLSKPDLAISTLERVINIAPDDPYFYVLLGNAYKENKKINDAIGYYKRAIKIEPDNVLLKINLGLACGQISDYKCVIDNLSKVVSVYPNELQATFGLALAYHGLGEYDLAKRYYKSLLEYEPKNLSFWYNLAKTQLALGEYQDAKNSIDNAISTRENFVDLYLDRAQINYKLNKLEDAESDYLKALSLDPQNPEIPVEFGTFLWRTGAYLKASDQFSKAYDLQPDNPDLLVKKAYLLQVAKEEKDAVENWQMVLSNEKNNKFALFNLAKLYQEKEDFESAIKYYKDFISLKDNVESDGLEANLGLAYCFQKNDNYNEAKEIHENVLRQNPNHSIALYNLGLLLNEKESHKEAVLYLEKAIKNNFSLPAKAFKALAHSYRKLNDSVNLKTTYKKWLEIDNNNLEARIDYADFLAGLGEMNEAGDQFRVAAALDTTHRTRYELAKFLLKEKDLYGAVGQLQEYLKSYPEDLNGLILLANAFKDLGIKEQAINTYKKIVSLQYDNYLAYYNLGLLYEQEKQYEQAKNYLLKSIEINDKYAPAYYALGISYMSNEEIAKAKELFEKYLRVAPGGEYKDVVEAKLKELIEKPVASQPKV